MQITFELIFEPIRSLLFWKCIVLVKKNLRIEKEDNEHFLNFFLDPSKNKTVSSVYCNMHS